MHFQSCLRLHLLREMCVHDGENSGMGQKIVLFLRFYGNEVDHQPDDDARVPPPLHVSTEESTAHRQHVFTAAVPPSEFRSRG